MNLRETIFMVAVVFLLTLIFGLLLHDRLNNIELVHVQSLNESLNGELNSLPDVIPNESEFSRANRYHDKH